MDESTAAEAGSQPGFFPFAMQYIWITTLTFMVAVTIAVVRQLRTAPHYSAQATVHLHLPGDVPEDALKITVPLANAFERLRSKRMLRRAMERVGRPLEEIQMSLLDVSYESIRNTTIFSITVNATDPVLAADLANAMAEEYCNFHSEWSDTIFPRVSILDLAVPSAAPETQGNRRSIFIASNFGIGLGLILTMGVAWLNFQRQNMV